jgi:hypothetical protein
MKNIAELVTLHDAKVSAHNISLQYYDSTRQPQYLTERLRDFFNQNTHYTMNWMSVVVDAVRNKETIEAFTVAGVEKADDARTDILNTIWDRNQGACEADLVHEYVHATGEGCIVAGVDGDGKALFFANDPRCIEIVYGDTNPREIIQAAKFWMDGKTHKATVWTAQDDGVYEETLTGRSTTKTDAALAQIESGITYTSDGDPIKTAYPRVPVFHFRRSARNIKPEFYQVQSIQDSINKTFVALGFSIENAADRIRWAITNSDMSVFQQAKAGDVVAIPPSSQYEQQTALGEFGAADLQQISALLDGWVGNVAAITATPYHFFSNDGASGLSGEALQALESPLVAKITRYIRRLSPVWEDLASFALTVEGSATTTDEVTCTYADPRTTLVISQATARATNVQAGIPVTWQLRQEGFRESDIEQLLDDRIRETPPDLDEAALQEVYDRMSERNTRLIEPILKEALDAISAAALDQIRASKVVEQAAETVNNGG